MLSESESKTCPGSMRADVSWLCEYLPEKKKRRKTKITPRLGSTIAYFRCSQKVNTRQTVQTVFSGRDESGTSVLHKLIWKEPKKQHHAKLRF